MLLNTKQQKLQSTFGRETPRRLKSGYLDKLGKLAEKVKKDPSVFNERK